MSRNNAEIGTVVSVSGNTITIQLSNSIKSNSPIIDGAVYKIGQIGSFLKIPLGYSNLFGIVTQTGVAAIPDNLTEVYKENPNLVDNRQWLTLTLIGEQIGTRFERGIFQSPTTGDLVHIVTIDDMKYIYGGFQRDSSIDIGNISASESLTAYFNFDKLLSRHFAILGSTGSGKSNSVGVILNAIVDKQFPKTRILLLDPHGEYNSVFHEKSTVYKVSPENAAERLYIPYWALSFSEFMALFDGTITEQNKEYFRTKIIDAKIKGASENSLAVDPTTITADSPIPYSLKQLWFELDSFEHQTYKDRGNENTILLKTPGDATNLIPNQYEPYSPNNTSPYQNQNRKGLTSFLDSIRTKMLDMRFKFLFDPGDYSPDLNGKTSKDLSELLYSWIAPSRPITIFDISDVPSEIMMSVSGTLLNIVYEALFWGQEMAVGGRKQPLLVVLEEAHNYLKSGDNSISSKIVQRIAKEGRKYGVGLMLVTQRPSELDETVLSQCGTIVALRMNNSRDRGFVSSAIQDELKSLIDLLPSLRTGEAIVSGEGVSIPSRIQFYKLSYAPKSSAPEVSKCWKDSTPIKQEDYTNLVSLWRNKNFEEAD
jgi:DNA helicase HerA-like ATPase